MGTRLLNTNAAGKPTMKAHSLHRIALPAPPCGCGHPHAGDLGPLSGHPAATVRVGPSPLPSPEARYRSGGLQFFRALYARSSITSEQRHEVWSLVSRVGSHGW